MNVRKAASTILAVVFLSSFPVAAERSSDYKKPVYTDHEQEIINARFDTRDDLLVFAKLCITKTQNDLSKLEGLKEAKKRLKSAKSYVFKEELTKSTKELEKALTAIIKKISLHMARYEDKEKIKRNYYTKEDEKPPLVFNSLFNSVRNQNLVNHLQNIEAQTQLAMGVLNILIGNMKKKTVSLMAAEDQEIYFKNFYLNELHAVANRLNSLPLADTLHKLICPRCSHPNGKGCRYCGDCGQRLQPAESKLCPVCKNKCQGDANFCPNCGHKYTTFK